MKPFEDPALTLYQGDALAVLQSFPPLCVDAVITDPPYSSGGLMLSARQRSRGQVSEQRDSEDISADVRGQPGSALVHHVGYAVGLPSAGAWPGTDRPLLMFFRTGGSFPP